MYPLIIKYLINVKGKSHHFGQKKEAIANIASGLHISTS
jgi:hypothetical protein